MVLFSSKRSSSWSLSTEKWAKVVHQQVKTRTKSNGNLHRKASFTEYVARRLWNTWQLHISYLVCYNKWCNDNILCLTHWCYMKLELCIDNALFTNMIHSLLDNQKSNTSRTNQNTVKSRAVDRSTIQFLTIFGVLLTHGSYKWIIMHKKCGRPDSNGFQLKWRFGTHGNWKNQNPGGRFGAIS